ncbi:Cytochrome P450 monooxygenase [Pseudocercospora fuligena]|uniref:Cytochrome P450 monooxygenase n=1 Tax=Pseudocercospora fuligena TaxID=685502 RepID=A0A8H6RAT2_9PEZI|nr:Cytochrome P450 monooxygenase [Pseudocercospora fuligena]
MATSYILSQINIPQFISYALLLLISYKCTLYIQRLYFHPLSKFPGPKIMAMSRVYEFYWDSYLHGRLWSHLPSLHDKYGPIVRIGPDEIHIRDSAYFDHIFGFRPLDKWAIAARQFGLKYAMFGIEEYKLYVKRRAAFGDSFSKSKSFKLQPLVNEKIEKGCKIMRRKGKEGGSVDLAFLFRAVTAEIITEYMYGQQYGFFEDERTTRGLYDRRFDVLFGVTHLGRFIPWMVPIILIFLRSQIKALFGSKEPTASFLDFNNFAEKMQRKLIEQEGTHVDLNIGENNKTAAEVYIHSSLPLGDKTGSALTQATMAAWSGGWDTTAFSLTQTAYLVLQHPDVLKKLQAELREVWPDMSEDASMALLGDLPYLNAVVKEGLRLMHGALSRLTRVNPAVPEQYKGWTIPPGTKISMSTSDLHYDKEIWGDDVLVFRPDRWIDRPDLDRWLATFSKGTRVCAGQELAWLELKMILGALFRRFEMRIPEDEKVTDADILPYCDGFTPGPKNNMQRLPVVVKSVAS